MREGGGVKRHKHTQRERWAASLDSIYVPLRRRC
jgi:hypothetical protein